MNIVTLIILEAAKIISENPDDVKTIREQKRIFNEYANALIANAQEALAESQEGKEERG